MNDTGFDVGSIMVSLLLTALAYGLFPIIFASLRSEAITKKKYRTIVIVVTIGLKILFAIISSNFNWAPAILWGTISYNIGKGMLSKKGLFSDEKVPSDDDVASTSAMPSDEELETVSNTRSEEELSSLVLNNTSQLSFQNVDEPQPAETEELLDLTDEKEVEIPEDDERTEEYYFENMDEFLAYIKLRNNPNAKIIWLKGSNYINQYKTAYDCFEKKQYAKAVDEYKKCLELNPIGISARFEIAEALMQWGKMDEAISELNGLVKFLTKPQEISKFYRRYGYAFTEKNEPFISAACYLYSNEFEKSAITVQELMYISQAFELDVEQLTSVNARELLEENNVPIIEPTDENTIKYDMPPVIKLDVNDISNRKRREEEHLEVIEQENTPEVETSQGEEIDADIVQENQESQKEESAQKRCVHCGKEIKENSKFCSYCGKPIIEETSGAIFCHKCGYKLLPNSKFCSKCGTKV